MFDQYLLEILPYGEAMRISATMRFIRKSVCVSYADLSNFVVG